MAYENLPENFQAGRVMLSQERPYLSSALYRVIPIAKPGMGTMGVDKWWRLYFDPDCKWEPRVVATVLYHEMGHLLRNHAGREEGMIEPDHDKWNRAADCEINDDIQQEMGQKAKWPFEVCLPSTFKLPDGLAAEEYYARMPNPPKGQGQGQGKPKAGSGDCGTAAGGQRRSWEDGPPPGETDGKTGEKGDKNAPHGIGDAEGDLVRGKVAEDVREAAKNRGNVPGWLERWAEAILNPVVPWQKILAGAIRHSMAEVAGMVNFTYQRPSRRAGVSANVIFPAMRKPVPNIVAVVDTSGSMSSDNLADVLGEINGILKSAGATGVDVLVADADVKSAKRVFKASQIQLAGGGGTDMRVGIQAAMQRPIKPHIIVVLTDGYTPWPDSPVGPKVVAAIVGGGSVQVPDWITRVNVDK